MKICPMTEQICQSTLKSLPSTKKSLKILPKTLKVFAKVAKIRQIWSHCLTPSQSTDCKISEAQMLHLRTI